MGVNSLPKTVTRQLRDFDMNPGPSAPESSTLTTRLPSHVVVAYVKRVMGLLVKPNWLQLNWVAQWGGAMGAIAPVRARKYL